MAQEVADAGLLLVRILPVLARGCFVQGHNAVSTFCRMLAGKNCKASGCFLFYGSTG
jgi:hypothetical protein